MSKKRYEKNSYSSLGMGTGILIGMSIGVLTGKIAITMSLGLLIGIAVGSLLDARKAKKGR